jgi:peptidylprolyl isomerase
MTSKDFDEDVKRIGLWDKALGAANENAQAWLDEMIAIYQSDPVRYNGVGLTLMEIVRREGQLDRVEDVHQAARVILETPPAPLDPPLIDAIGYIGYASCDFDLAQKAWTKYSQDAVLPEASNSKFQTIDLAKQQWELEQQYRKDDAGKDNPIVQLITTKGTLTVELFEDQAPNSVANFIYLIEHDYYSRLRIFKVLEKFGIQTGCKLGDGSSNAGYTIPSEAALADSRKVFRGSLFYAIGASKDTNALDPSTASSQFVIATTPLPTLNDQVTVFGRVIDGEFKLGTFRKVDLTKEEQKKDPNIETDYLARSTITKKRDHQYLPEILEGKLPY